MQEEEKGGRQDPGNDVRRMGLLLYARTRVLTGLLVKFRDTELAIVVEFSTTGQGIRLYRTGCFGDNSTFA